MRWARLLAIAGTVIGLVACQSMETPETASPGEASRGEAAGTVSSAAAAPLGAAPGRGGGTLAGTLVSSYLGNRLGARFDTRDRAAAEQAESDAVINNRTTTWVNQNTGVAGEVRPRRTYIDSDGRTCREYDHAVTIQGRQEIGTGTACRDEGGTWRLAGT